MYCTECGTKNEDGMQFCVQCGAPLDSAQVDLSSQPLEPTQSALGNRLCMSLQPGGADNPKSVRESLWQR